MNVELPFLEYMHNVLVNLHSNIDLCAATEKLEHTHRVYSDAVVSLLQ
jgi:hypothetical protein